MYTATPIPVLTGSAAQRFETNAQRNEARRGSQNLSAAYDSLKEILNRSAK